MVREIGPSQTAQAVYGRQQFYADRTVELKIPKTVQIGALDKVTLSPDVQAMRSAQSPSIASQAISATQASVYFYSQPVKQLTYEDLRRVHTRSSESENATVDQVEPDREKDDSELTPGIGAVEEPQGGSPAGPR